MVQRHRRRSWQSRTPEERQAAREHQAAVRASLRQRLEAFTAQLSPDERAAICRRFPDYSERNALLVEMQCRERFGHGAVEVHGFHGWRDRGRKVRKRPDDVPEGAWALRIVQPGARPDTEDGEGDPSWYRLGTVFDRCQTDPIGGDFNDPPPF